MFCCHLDCPNDKHLAVSIQSNSQHFSSVVNKFGCNFPCFPSFKQVPISKSGYHSEESSFVVTAGRDDGCFVLDEVGSIVGDLVEQ